MKGSEKLGREVNSREDSIKWLKRVNFSANYQLKNMLDIIKITM